MHSKRNLLALLALAGLGITAHAQAAAADWPNKPIRWVVPFPPGGAMDAIARTLGEKAAKSLGQPFVIENKPGAGGNIGADFVAKQPGDGDTMMITSIGMATNKPLYGKLNYDPVKDFAPVSLLAVVPNVLVTNATQPDVKTARDVIAAARKAPGKLTYASAGNGTSIHLAGEVFTSLAQVEMLHIPYKGSGPAVSDLLGGQVNYMFDSITSARPHIESGKLRALGVTTAKRSSTLPNVPTLAETGVPGYEVSPWFAVFMPASTPKAIVGKLNKALLDAMKDPEVVKRFESIGAEPVGSTPDELAKHLARESDRWTKLITERGIKLD
ncbi:MULTISPECIES: tripartite tricarboxylate transporter substrate binding protein [unclassified Acidovorax]|jgi:tripartite-type tricarboxylate transporter receptor subunit TctC|uniref:tripartite tricarboxylate transporter substrate binding protein n=1 Tax=unclassified Acidovorax TaxID=2684926 RepID=UPI000BDC80E9|nr:MULTISPECIES: tripartite tricarboxylate transporter substrate binding protein [unclassified Acidovorax]HQS20338.1 tripartite tricarboxylate transporter substrate binding protein [Acidovorax defluvii]OYY87783.1 MAG: LacI family transcriptional regulator [Acidovorax sp. 28-64-14]OYZ46954.1 MAG: LacI family transcriptional regulator [Acidovorax sp. 16-64-162]OYZ70136.1 MAG: LacI family transcriptional regulator [Acidovorax sp. 24-64-9]OZA71583.1 MAG: LacI family transcriptional regulator [Acid